MPDLDIRLARCFAAVLPGVSEEEASAARRDQVDAWDSLATVTLVRVVEEEFGITVDLFELENLDSFAAWREYLSSQAAPAE
ncbi:MAG: acyl carrier protein [Bryobacteraceae bacterium]|nr:acyl carrier protein [Bryobacteraceae bacterium]